MKFQIKMHIKIHAFQNTKKIASDYGRKNKRLYLKLRVAKYAAGNN